MSSGCNFRALWLTNKTVVVSLAASALSIQCLTVRETAKHANIGVTSCPLRVFSRDKLIARLQDKASDDRSRAAPFGCRARRVLAAFGDGFAVYEAAVGLESATNRLRKLPSLLPCRQLTSVFARDHSCVAFATADARVYVLDFKLSGDG